MTPSLELEAGYTSNAFLVTEDEPKDADLFLVVRPAVSVHGEGARVNADFTGSLGRSHSIWNVQGGHTSVNLLGRGQAEWAEDTAFLDLQTSISEQATQRDRPSSSSTSGLRTNHTTVYAMNLAQSFRHAFGSMVNGEIVLRYSPVLVTTSDLGDSHEYFAKAGLSSGRWFQRFRWGMQASYQETREDDRVDPAVRETLDSNYSWALTRTVSAIGSVGYESIEDETLADAPDGLIWSAGLELRPGRRTFVSGSYGERFDQDTFSFLGRYEFSPRTSIRASFDQTLQTSRQRVLGDLSNIVTAEINGETKFINLQTGQVHSSLSELFTTNAATFRVKTFRLSAQTGGRRSRLAYTGSWSEKDSDVSVATTNEDYTSADQITFDSRLSYSRTLSRRLSGDLAFSYDRTVYDLATDRTEERYRSSLIMNYLLAQNVTLTGGYEFSLGKSSIAGEGFDEHVGFVRFRREF